MDGWSNEKYDCVECKKPENGYYKNRNCSKFFPNDIKKEPRDVWQAIHRRNDKASPWDAGLKCDECPVSFISQESKDLIQIDIRQSIAFKSTGASLYGPDLSKWPAVLVEALTLLQSENNVIENGLMEADRQPT